MKKEKLIEELQKLPDDIEVCLFDWRKNLCYADGDDEGCGEGIYPDLEINVYSLEANEAKFYKEQNDKDYKSFALLSFDNDDYDDDGFMVNSRCRFKYER